MSGNHILVTMSRERERNKNKTRKKGGRIMRKMYGQCWKHYQSVNIAV